MKKFKKDPAPKVTVLVAHPDDETLWAGGLLHSHPEWDLSIVSLYEKALISPDLHPEDWSHDSHQEPHYSFWFYKIYRNNRFDLLGNSLAIRSGRSEEHTSELQSRGHLVCRLLLETK